MTQKITENEMALQTGEYQGFLKDLVDKLAQDLEFEYVLTHDLLHGNPTDDGNWTGLIGSLVNRVRNHLSQCFKQLFFDSVTFRLLIIDQSVNILIIIYHFPLQEADLGLDDLTVTSQRSQVVDFSTPYESSTLQVMLQVSTVIPQILRIS